MGKTEVLSDTILSQCSRGYRMRRIATTTLAINTLDTIYKLGVFIAPCKCTVTKVSVNACPYPISGTSSTLDVAKANIGGADHALITQEDIDSQTSDTEIECTLATTAGYLDLIEGQLVYATITIVGAASTPGQAITVQVEYVPTER